MKARLNKGEAYTTYPALLQIEVAKIAAAAMVEGLQRMPTLAQLPANDRMQMMQFLSQLMGPGIPANTFASSPLSLFAPQAVAPKQSLPEPPAPQRP